MSERGARRLSTLPVQISRSGALIGVRLPTVLSEDLLLGRLSAAWACVFTSTMRKSRSRSTKASPILSSVTLRTSRSARGRVRRVPGLLFLRRRTRPMMPSSFNRRVAEGEPALLEPSAVDDQRQVFAEGRLPGHGGGGFNKGRDVDQISGPCPERQHLAPLRLAPRTSICVVIKRNEPTPCHKHREPQPQAHHRLQGLVPAVSVPSGETDQSCAH